MLKALCVRIRRTVWWMSTVPMSSRRDRQMSSVQKVPGRGREAEKKLVKEKAALTRMLLGCRTTSLTAWETPWEKRVFAGWETKFSAKAVKWLIDYIYCQNSSWNLSRQLSLVWEGFTIIQKWLIKFLPVHDTGCIYVKFFILLFLVLLWEMSSWFHVLEMWVGLPMWHKAQVTLKQFNQVHPPQNHKCIPVRPIPALQCTTTGGPPGGPVQLVPKLWTAASLRWRTCSRKSNIAEALLGTPKSGQLTYR